MKKFIHPLGKKTIVVMKNGRTYVKNWIFSRGLLFLETDLNSHFLWKTKKDINLNNFISKK